MALNPFIHNDGGTFRFQDYMSQIPGFLKGEEDVVVLLQLFSDYINNAYRNISVVKKFEFKLITDESKLGVVMNDLTKLADLLIRSDERTLPVLYLSKPISNPIGSNNYFIGRFDYGGKLENLDASIINVPKKDGDRVYITFSRDDQTANTGVYVYNNTGNALIKDPFGTTQDPFLNTPNELMETVGGLSPRIVQFTPSNISKVYRRKIKTVGTIIYYEVFFNATINDVENIDSIVPKNFDDSTKDYLIDYYDTINVVPSSYRYNHGIDFSTSCADFDWENTESIGKGLFYARELTRFGKQQDINVKTESNEYIDPIFQDKTETLKIKQITGDGTTATITTTNSHTLAEGNDFNIESISDVSPSAFVETNVKVKEVVSSVKFTYDTINTGTESNSANIITTSLAFTRDNEQLDKYSLRIPYNSLVSTTEFTTGDLVSRIEEQRVPESVTFLGDEVSLAQDWLITESETAFRGFEFQVGDKVVMRSNTEYSGTVTFPTGIDEGKLYTISNFVPESFNGVKLATVNMGALGAGRIDFSKLELYFDADTDVNITTNEITLQDADSETPFNISVGDAIKFRGTRTGSITLPAPLVEDQLYNILEIDADTETFKLTSDGTNEIIFSAVGSGIIDVIVLKKVSASKGFVSSVDIDSALDKGVILFYKYTGDLISTGEIAKINNLGNIEFIANIADISDIDIDSRSIPWSDVANTTYRKGTHVVYNGERYKTIKFVTITQKSLPPDEDATDYSLQMANHIIYDTNIATNPYMFGMYEVTSLAFDEEPDFEAGINEVSNKLYIRQVEDLELKYGYDQKEWLFNPRISPKDIVDRNGFLEIINNQHTIYDPVDGTVDPFIKAQTSEYTMALNGLANTINKPVDSLEYSTTSEAAIVKIDIDTEGGHGLRSGMRVTISGANDAAFNGSFTITVVDTETFTYVPLTVPTTSPDTGTAITMIFENTIVHKLHTFTQTPNTPTTTTDTIEVVTEENHGFIIGTEITISGATETGYNGTHIVTYTNDAKIFQYVISSTTLTSPETDSPAIASFQPSDADYINVLDQTLTNENGIYISREGRWVKYDDSKIFNNTVLFAKQNLFDITDNNPEIATGDEIKIASMTFNDTTKEVSVRLYEDHDYIVGTTVNVRNAEQSPYNGKFQIKTVPNSKEFTYLIEHKYSPYSPASPLTRRKLLCFSDKWYKYNISEIQWQKKSNVLRASFNPIEGGTEWTLNSFSEFVHDNNLTLLSGEYNFTYRPNNYDTSIAAFVEGDIVNLNDQLVTSENAKYRVKQGKWQLLDEKLSMKVRDINVDYVEAEQGIDSDEDPLFYTRFNDTEITEYTSENFDGDLQVFQVDNLYASNWEFIYEKIENVDTIASHHKTYNAKYDKNAVVTDRSDMDSSFIGVSDMKYPMVEKIERLVYLKDPNVIDFEFITELARYMGYDITLLIDDIQQSAIYKTDKEKEMAVRKTIQNLPQFYALKSTKSGLESMLLAFGIVGDIVTMWTDADKQYEEFIPDYQVRDTQYANLINLNKTIRMVSTPHFKLNIDIDGNFDNQLNGSELNRLRSSIVRYKPINTVFDDITLYLKFTLRANIVVGEMRGQGRMQFDIGFDDIEFDYGAVIGNDCF